MKVIQRKIIFNIIITTVELIIRNDSLISSLWDCAHSIILLLKWHFLSSYEFLKLSLNCLSALIFLKYFFLILPITGFYVEGTLFLLHSCLYAYKFFESSYFEENNLLFLIHHRRILQKLLFLEKISFTNF